ncbi:MAG: bifunctional glycoside hydrolase 114/ polysaccharide deacetylase family protein [Geobacteraceae bacterium]|nr:bifunctional glycoside hydrolase 114/ polysaccharide deacetylase family protein [Geobacteraceae bacterium]
MIPRTSGAVMLLTLLFVMMTPCSYSADPSVAFFYANNPPADELKAFDIVVVDPGSGLSPSSYGNRGSELFAYVSLGETDPGVSYEKKLADRWVIGTNKGWGSRIMDVSDPGWQRFFLDEVVAPLWEAGYRGFFLDTLDSYQIAAKKERHAAMEQGIVRIIQELKKRWPGARLILNRGFEVFDRVRPHVFAVAAESLYKGYSPEIGGYHDVPDKERAWLLDRLNHVRKLGLPVISIDYLPPGNRRQARETAEKIKRQGFIPWVADKDLSSLGVGSVEVVPRRILGLYDGREAAEPSELKIHRFAVMPLNHMGYTVELRDMGRPLPDMIMEGRYAGVVVWPFTEKSARSGFGEWLAKTVREGVKVAFLESFGMPVAGFPGGMGMTAPIMDTPHPPFRILEKSRMMGFETPPVPLPDNFQPVAMKSGEVLLKIADRQGAVSEVAGITSWGGYALYPFVIGPVLDERTAWVVDPFRFFRETLRLPLFPVPDTTTENGSRLLLSHVDGDGYESRSEWPGGGYAAQELRVRILEKYRIPVTVSVITGITAPNGLYPDRSREYEEYARKIFALPWVEPASHSFSHPFKWHPDKSADAEAYHLKIPNYRFNLEDEIAGSLEYINRRLLPTGKKARMFHWTGDCNPTDEAVAAAYRAGVGNINGGNTLMTESYRSITAVAPLGIDRGGLFQVYAPNENENVYTNLWTSGFAGYGRVLETFRLTDGPRRLKPVNIYYHFYSATKQASLAALDKVHSWAAGQHLNSIFASGYAERVLDFNRTVVARTSDGWLVRNGGSLREMRIPSGLGFPSLGTGVNIAGFNEHNGERYVHLGPSGTAQVKLRKKMDDKPYVSRVNGTLKKFVRNGRGMSFTLTGMTAMELVLENAGQCTVFSGNRALVPASAKNGRKTYRLKEGEHALKAECGK